MFTAIVLIFYIMLLHRGQHSLRTLTLLSRLCYRRHLLVEGFICAFTLIFTWHILTFLRMILLGQLTWKNGLSSHCLEKAIPLMAFVQRLFLFFFCFGFKSIGKIEQGSHMGQDWWQGSLYIARYYYLLLYRIVIT